MEHQDKPVALLAQSPIWEGLDGGTLTVACSGGMDSVGLARAAHELLSNQEFCSRFKQPPKLTLWHLDHGIRPDSDTDARFVDELGRQLGVAVIIERASIADEQRAQGGNLEELARIERYSRLLTYLRQAERDTSWEGSCLAVTAHHQGDQAETILHHLVRGTHLAGLRGIAPVADSAVYRPWLELPLAEIRSYLKDLGQSWRDDPSNKDTALTRNLLRHEVMPLLERINPQAQAHIARLAGMARDAAKLFAAQLNELRVQERSKRNVDRWLPLVGWPAGDYYAYRLERGWHSSGLLAAFAAEKLKALLGGLNTREHELIDLWAGEPQQQVEFKSMRLCLVHPEVLSVQSIKTRQDDVAAKKLQPGDKSGQGGLEVVFVEPQAGLWARHRLSEREPWEQIASWPEALAQMMDSPPQRPSWQCFLPGGVRLPLMLRDWRNGDRIELSSGGTKKLGDVFTDAKIPACFRPVWAVLTDADDRVVWVPGLADSAQMQLAEDQQPAWVVILRESV